MIKIPTNKSPLWTCIVNGKTYGYPAGAEYADGVLPDGVVAAIKAHYESIRVPDPAFKEGIQYVSAKGDIKSVTFEDIAPDATITEKGVVKQAAEVTPIVVPESVAAVDVANKINDVLTALKDAGLMKS